LKGFSIFISVFALCALFALSLATLFVRRHPGLRPDPAFFPPVIETFRRVMSARSGVEAGREYGRAHAQTDCEPEALRRLERCDGDVCRAGLEYFMITCLRAARPSSGLCADVPAELSEALWTINRCATVSRSQPERCYRILDARAFYCHNPMPPVK
jgi:hypothetical protein